jgi:hypothetical protein
VYPDEHDVELTLKTIPGLKPTARSIWPDVVLVRSFLDESYGRCRNHGRAEFVPFADLKKFAESFIGRQVHQCAVHVAIAMQRLQTKISSSDKSVVLVKLPPLARFEEVRERWVQHQWDLEKEIGEEQHPSKQIA